MKTATNPERLAAVSFPTCKGKDTKNDNELQILFDYLQHSVCTATMATAATGIVQKSICRYKRTLEKMGLLFVIDLKPCPITGFMAQWITTDPFLTPKITSKQLSLFMEGQEL